MTLTASGEGSAMVSVTASAGGMTTKEVSILFRAMPSVGSDATDDGYDSAELMFLKVGWQWWWQLVFPDGAAITFNVDP